MCAGRPERGSDAEIQLRPCVDDPSAVEQQNPRNRLFAASRAARPGRRIAGYDGSVKCLVPSVGTGWLLWIDGWMPASPRALPAVCYVRIAPPAGVEHPWTERKPKDGPLKLERRRDEIGVADPGGRWPSKTASPQLHHVKIGPSSVPSPSMYVAH